MTVEVFDPTVTVTLDVALPEVGGIEPPLVVYRGTISDLVQGYLSSEDYVPALADLRITLAGRHIEPEPTR